MLVQAEAGCSQFWDVAENREQQASVRSVQSEQRQSAHRSGLRHYPVVVVLWGGSPDTHNRIGKQGSQGAQTETAWFCSDLACGLFRTTAPRCSRALSISLNSSLSSWR